MNINTFSGVLTLKDSAQHQTYHQEVAYESKQDERICHNDIYIYICIYIWIGKESFNRYNEQVEVIWNVHVLPTQPNANGRLFPVPKGTVAIAGGWDNLRSETTPRSHPAVPSPPATWREQNTCQLSNYKFKKSHHILYNIISS